MARPLNRDIYKELLKEYKQLQQQSGLAGVEAPDFTPTTAKQIRKQHIEKLRQQIDLLKESLPSREISERGLTADQETYADIIYHNILSTITNAEAMARRRTLNGAWIVKSFIQENYATHGAKFIMAIAESPYFQILQTATELYGYLRTESAANQLIGMFATSLGIDPENLETNDFGTLWEEDDIDEDEEGY